MNRFASREISVHDFPLQVAFLWDPEAAEKRALISFQRTHMARPSESSMETLISLEYPIEALQRRCSTTLAFNFVNSIIPSRNPGSIRSVISITFRWTSMMFEWRSSRYYRNSYYRLLTNYKIMSITHPLYDHYFRCKAIFKIKWSNCMTNNKPQSRQT